MGPLAKYMHDDHARIDALLDQAVAEPRRFDHAAYGRARALLLRHIGIEEKILLPDAKRRRGGEPLSVAKILRREHSAIASLLVPTPDHALVAELRTLLEMHNAREEGPGGLYEVCGALAGEEASALLEAARAAKEVPAARYFDGERATRTAKEALARAVAAHRNRDG